MTRLRLERFRRWETLLVLVAVANWLWVAALIAFDKGLPPYSSIWSQLPYSIWILAPTRLLLASVCLWSRRWWADTLALLITVQLVAAAFVNTLNPDYLYYVEPGFPVLNRSLIQTGCAAVLLPVALSGCIRRLQKGRLRSGAILVSGALALLAVVGYTSNVVSQPAAQRETARFVTQAILLNRPFAASERSYLRFHEIGAPVKKSPGFLHDRPSAEIMFTGFVAPFVLSTGYDYYNGPKDNLVGDALTVAFFGRAVLLDGRWNGWPSLMMKWWLCPY